MRREGKADKVDKRNKEERDREKRTHQYLLLPAVLNSTEAPTPPQRERKKVSSTRYTVLPCPELFRGLVTANGCCKELVFVPHCLQHFYATSYTL